MLSEEDEEDIRMAMFIEVFAKEFEMDPEVVTKFVLYCRENERREKLQNEKLNGLFP